MGKGRYKKIKVLKAFPHFQGVTAKGAQEGAQRTRISNNPIKELR